MLVNGLCVCVCVLWLHQLGESYLFWKRQKHPFRFYLWRKCCRNRKQNNTFPAKFVAAKLRAARLWTAR